MKKKIFIGLLVASLFVPTVPVYACTPKLNPPHIEIPEIKVDISDELKEAFENAAKNFIEKNKLEVPEIESAMYLNMDFKWYKYSCVTVKWNTVENATRYKVRITKQNGEQKEFETDYNAFIISNYSDDFLNENMEGAVVQVKALGENGVFSLWTVETELNSL